MMYGFGGNEASDACRRDIEGEAKRLKEKIDIFYEMKNSTEKFIMKGYMHWIDEREHRNSLLVVFAGLTLELPHLEGEYLRLLEEMDGRGSEVKM